MHENIVRNSSKQFPDWMKTHQVFDEVKINKVFPKIGLPNFKSTCNINLSTEARNAAQRLGNWITNYIYNKGNTIYNKLDQELVSPTKNNELCAKLQATWNLIQSVYHSIGFGDFVKTLDGKVSLRLRSDIFLADPTPVFKKDESLIKVAGKLFEMIKECGITVDQLDQIHEFKEFSKVNIPAKEYPLVFSSSKEEGLWDIATISMRGIASCQSWTAPQSRGLIGTLVSKFAGVVYIASDQNVPDYGSKMIYRCVVRMVINRLTKKPFLLMDTMYPSFNSDVCVAFKKALKDKCGIDAYHISDTIPQKSLPLEKSINYLKQGEVSYMDHGIPVEQFPALINKRVPDITILVSRINDDLSNEIDNQVRANRNAYIEANKTLETLLTEYNAKKKAWDENPQGEFDIEKPKMDKALHNFGKGGVLNFLTHCDKKHKGYSAANLFIKPILNSIKVNDHCSSPEEYSRRYLATFIRNQQAIKEEALKTVNSGTWRRSFPKSSIRFFEFIFTQVKEQLLARTKIKPN